MKIYLISFILFTSLLLSCSIPENEEIDENANLAFFEIVYEVRATKSTDTEIWTNVEGSRRYLFEETTDEEVSVDGTFTVVMENYREPQFLSNVCSGGFLGTYDTTDSFTEDETEDGPYSPLDPYEEGITEEDNFDDDQEVAEVLVFNFVLTVDETDLTASCPNVISESNIQAVRFSSGDVILTDQSRNLEYYLVPDLIE